MFGLRRTGSRIPLYDAMGCPLRRHPSSARAPTSTTSSSRMQHVIVNLAINTVRVIAQAESNYNDYRAAEHHPRLQISRSRTAAWVMGLRICNRGARWMRRCGYQVSARRSELLLQAAHRRHDRVIHIAASRGSYQGVGQVILRTIGYK